MKGMLKDLFCRFGRQKDKEEAHSTEKKKQSLPLIRYLIYLLLVTVTITGVSLSRYSTSVSTDDVARVAKFDVVVSPAVPSGDVSAHAANGNKVYSFNVTNYSDVTVEVQLFVDSYNTNQPTVTYVGSDPPVNGWFRLAPNASRTVDVTIVGISTGNAVSMHVEYRQVD